MPWVELAALAALLASIVVPVVLLGGPSQTTARSAPSPAPGPLPRNVFEFATPTVRVSALGHNKAGAAAAAAAERIRASLGAFYDQAFMAPETWTRGIPWGAWDAFGPDVRTQAQHDAASLGLGAQVHALSRLAVDESTLGVRVLVDPRGAIVTVGADVQFVATGFLRDGRLLHVSSKASFLFKQLSGRWLIVGYPLASIELNTVTPSPSPSPSATSSIPTPPATSP